MKKRMLPSWFRAIKDYVYLLLGSFIVAVTFNVFLNDFNIASGGVIGISVIVEEQWGFKPAYTQWMLSGSLLLMGFFILGKQFGVKSIIGTMILPFFVLITQDWQSITDEPLLASLFGGVGIGMGLGLVFKGRASTGGLDLVAQIVHRFIGYSPGASLLIIDGIVVLTAGMVFGPEQALYALITLFITGKTIDIVQVGLGYAKLCFIITNRQDEIKEAILFHLDRGVTRMSGYGGYTDETKTIFMCVVNQKEVTRLKEVVREQDPHAFVIVSDAAEVLGEGFRGY